MLSALSIRLRSLFRHSKVEVELDDELRFHQEQQADKYMRAGMSRNAALRQVRLFMPSPPVQFTREFQFFLAEFPRSASIVYREFMTFRRRAFAWVCLLGFCLPLGVLGQPRQTVCGHLLPHMRRSHIPDKVDCDHADCSAFPSSILSCLRPDSYR
jgi:hypothetical protein